jgi:uncharacterized protein (TIGR01319 family)
MIQIINIGKSICVKIGRPEKSIDALRRKLTTRRRRLPAKKLKIPKINMVRGHRKEGSGLMSNIKLLVDIGSTFTKAVAVDVDQKAILLTAKSPTTVKEDVTIGLTRALAKIAESIAIPEDREIIACSSAAGGLRMVSIGLVPELSSEAAKRAALGAGAKIIGHYSHQLTRREIRQIEESTPDLILLAGGTDGGNETAITHNAEMLSHSSVTAAIIVAGNKCAYDRIEDIFSQSGKAVRFVDNVMPEIGKLEVQPCREAIREVFMARIVHAKGLDKAKDLIDHVIMPTPAAVLKAAVLLHEGTHGEKGLGELIVVDVGGATTDVYSIAKGNSSRGLMMKGLPEPFAKRTVEGDLGVRHNIETLNEICVNQGITLNSEILSGFHCNPETLPHNKEDKAVDDELARVAAETSFDRHVGKLETVYGANGEMLVQIGKDLSGITTIIGTGGPIIHSTAPAVILASLLAKSENGNPLKPTTADFYLDEQYIMYAAGLLSQSEPLAALAIMKKYLRKI